MVTIDLKKELRELYTASKSEPKIVTVPPFSYVAIDGKGDPNSSESYANAIQTLYPVAYAIKFMSKLEHDLDFSVMPLESLWWADDMSDFIAGNKDEWQWRAMILQPSFVTEGMYEQALVKTKHKRSLPLADRLTFITYDEGLAAQILHVGPYASEGPTIERLHQFIRDHDGSLEGSHYHHEIYMSDPRRTSTDKLKTIIRQPYTAA